MQLGIVSVIGINKIHITEDKKMGYNVAIDGPARFTPKQNPAVFASLTSMLLPFPTYIMI